MRSAACAKLARGGAVAIGDDDVLLSDMTVVIYSSWERYATFLFTN